MPNEVPTAPPPPPNTPPPPPGASKSAEQAPTPAPQQQAAPPQQQEPAPAAAPVQPAAGADVSDSLLLIPLSMIDLMEGQQHRISRSPEKQAELTASIKANGQNDPVKVKKNGNRYQLVYGHGRLQALKDLGIDRIRAELFYGSDQEAALLALSENVNREELNPIEVALGIREAMKRGASLPEIATKLGKVDENAQPNVVWVEQHLELLNLNEKQRDDVANNMMSKSVALRLAKMKTDNRNEIFKEMEKVAEGEKKPSKPKKGKGKGKTKSKDGTPPPPPPAKKTSATLEKAQEKVTGKSKDKFIGTKAAREVYNEIKKLDHEYVPTEEKAVVKEMLDLIDYLLGKRKSKPLQLDVE